MKKECKKDEEEELVVVDAMPVHQRRHRLLRKALWVNTWLLLGLAIASRQELGCAVAEAASVEVDPHGNTYLEVLDEDEDDDDHDEKEVEEYHESWAHQHINTNDDKDGGVIVIATVDGSIAGLSRETGQVLWKQSGVSLVESDLPTNNDSNDTDDDKSRVMLGPLVSTTTTTKSSSQDWRTAAVPAVDGRVFLTAGRDSELTATSTLKELVARAPFVDARGRFYVGSRQATAAAIDKKTGEILRVVSGGASTDIDLEGKSVVWVGRVDYSISLFDARSGVMDVKFSSSELMGVQDMVVDDIENPDGTLNLGGQQHAPRLMLPNGAENKQLNMLIATPNGNVALRNPTSGAIEWVANESFDTPVAFALEASTGISLGVDILPDAPMPGGSQDYLASQLERQIDIIKSSQDPEQTIVGALSSGQLFAMPLGKRLSQERVAMGLPHSTPTTTTSSSSAIGTKPIGGKVPSLNRRPLHPHNSEEHQHQQRVDHTSTLAKKACAPNSPTFPACLVGGIHHNHDFDSDASFLESDTSVPDPAALLPFQTQQEFEQHFRKGKKTFFKLMESWLPPTMALIFVLSFEMGRRLRAKKRKERMSIQSAPFEGDQGSMTNGVRNIGVISVTDNVLGFGGHGTVVYKGTLDGRQVAVKRMLKAYHASADREISLLIESDGHPNVVRYFLKEAQGDFVYLALELCNMSLHDLIGQLRLHAPLQQQPQLTNVTKATLHQIASGVRHLHSLRIVHRDLKPANILLATRKAKKSAKNGEGIEATQILTHYEHGEFIAKISDMGLGKQLAGQSSFGLSTLGNASIQAGPNGESSRLTGAGPGSVGWQAPEVMAIRWSSETPSVKSNDSSARMESFVEASPLDGTMSTRTSRSVDIFSLGCIFHCTLVPGTHPFGDWFEREANIMRNKPSTEELLELSPDAHNLVTSMICRDPMARPTAKEVCEHPYFWSALQKLAFLCDISDRIECESQLVEEGKEASSQFGSNMFAIERNAAQVVSTSWDKKLDTDLISNVSKFRTYDPSSVRDFLRLMRNKHHHYDELPSHVKEKVGSNPDGLMAYFEIRFPLLLIHCYTMAKDFMNPGDALAVKYAIPIVRKPQRRRVEAKSSLPIGKPSAKSNEPKLTSEAATTETCPTDTLLQADGGEGTGKLAAGGDLLHTQDPKAVTKCSSANGEENVMHDDWEAIEGEDGVIAEDGEFCIQPVLPSDDIVIWEGSTAAKTFNCRGWLRADDEWTRRVDATLRKPNSNVTRCATDAKFRTRLCNHWDASHGNFCPMRKRNKCIFAHGPVELRVKEGKKNRWGKLVDKDGNNSNPKHSGGEDTYGAARSIETVRKEEGKWNTDKQTPKKPKSKGKQTVPKMAVPSPR